jgi:hypothetical protein
MASASSDIPKRAPAARRLAGSDTPGTTSLSRWVALSVVVQCVVVALLAWLAFQNTRTPPRPEGVDYYAILLTSGHVLYGRVGPASSGYYVLTDAYYLRSQTDPQTKEVRSSLVRRGSEWHEPTQTMINASNILFMEPVGSQSGVMKRIEEIKRQAGAAKP